MGFAENGPPVLRQLSVRAVVDVLLRQGPSSRVELARQTGISKQTMSDIIRTLEEGGYVRATGVVGGRVGRNAVTYELSPDIGYVAGAEVGASTVRLALADITGTVIAECEEKAVDRDIGLLIGQVGTMLRVLAARSGIDYAKIAVAAIATPGVVDPVTGGLRYAPNVAVADTIDLRACCKAVLGCDVVIENDVKAALIGEAWQGAAAGSAFNVFVQLGTGIGLGVMQGGTLQHGATGAAGEIAYLPIGADPTTEESLKRGALECAIGASGITARFERLGGPGGRTVKEIFDMARTGDPRACRTVRETAEIAALMVVAIGAMHDPQKIIFGGGIGRDPLMVEETRQALRSCSRREFSIETALLGQKSTIYGTIAIATNALHNALFTPTALLERRQMPPAPSAS
ncbi:MAG: ROK family protein [Allorhizobium sp.]